MIGWVTDTRGRTCIKEVSYGNESKNLIQEGDRSLMNLELLGSYPITREAWPDEKVEKVAKKPIF